MAYINKIKSRQKDADVRSFDIYDSDAVRIIRVSGATGSEWKKDYSPKNGLVEIQVPDVGTATNSSPGTIKVPDRMTAADGNNRKNGIILDKFGNISVDFPIDEIYAAGTKLNISYNEGFRKVSIPKASVSSFGLIKLGSEDNGYCIKIDEEGKIYTSFNGYTGFVEEDENMNFEEMINSNELSIDKYEVINNG